MHANHSAILEVNHLYGGYNPGKPVLHDVRFTVPLGNIVGLIGLNGAGKSTTIKHILGLLKPIRGHIRINGISREEALESYHAQFTYIPETPVLYEQLNLWEHLQMTAMAYGMAETDFRQRAEELLNMFDMERMAKWLPGTFSKGMKQKVMIMSAFLLQPALHIIDEPFIGLDPRAIRSLLKLMLEAKERGSGILMSTHILSTAERYCDRFVLLHEGRVLLKGTLAELREQTGMPAASLDDIFMRVTGEGADG